MKKVLLHICCGVCALASLKRLKKEGFYVEGFFYNPNIQPFTEYLKRKETALAVHNLNKINMIEGAYNLKQWLDICRKYKDEKEGGLRCRRCYELRLKETAKVCKEKEFDYFTTTLSISPYKRSEAIIEIGEILGKKKFLAVDFKKQEGFKETISLAKKHQFYRQNYCGCIYSKSKLKAKDRK
ncbi:MAG: epoxyqueuosine reductase QueH [Candidatus Omnitrophota bacterium]|nr:MAG: epoxyqueuosine reductase QueH [Candidatus Omnitrophota bacterium]